MPNDPFFARDPWGGAWGGGWYASIPPGGAPWWLGPTDPLWGILMPQPRPGELSRPGSLDPWTIIGGGIPRPSSGWQEALASIGALVEDVPNDVRSQLDYIWDLTRNLRAILDLLAARRLLRGYYDPDTGEWKQPHYEVTVTTTAPSETTTTPPERPEPRPEVGIIDWIWDPAAGGWVPVFSVTTYTSPPQETTTQTGTTTTTETPTTTVTGVGGTVTFPPGWIYDPIWDVYIPIPGITFVVDVTTTRPEEEYHTSPLPTTIGAPGRTTPWPPLTFTTTWTTWQDTTTTSTETTTTDTTTTGTTTTVVTPPPPPPPPEGGGAGAPIPGPPAPVVGHPLGESVWQLSQYIPALVPHLGYFLAGR